MSEEGSQVEEVVAVEPPKGLKFFISNVNSFVSQSLVEELRNDHKGLDEVSVHKFIGTKSSDENAEVPSGVSEVIENVGKSRSFRNHIFESDIIIYDLMNSEYDEVDNVIKTLTGDYDEEKTLILISSVMTWVNTPPKVKKEGEENEEGEGDDLSEAEEGEGDDGQEA